MNEKRGRLLELGAMLDVLKPEARERPAAAEPPPRDKIVVKPEIRKSEIIKKEIIKKEKSKTLNRVLAADGARLEKITITLPEALYHLLLDEALRRKTARHADWPISAIVRAAIAATMGSGKKPDRPAASASRRSRASARPASPDELNPPHGEKDGFEKVTISLPAETRQLLLVESHRRKKAGDRNWSISTIVRQALAAHIKPGGG